MSLQFSKKLCVRKEPERGCLAKITSSAPKGSCPILQLPSEVRACIFNYIIEDASLFYRFSPDFQTAKCLVRWPEYRKKLSFLKACKLFEAEALNLIQIKSVAFEVEDPDNTKKQSKKLNIPTTIWKSTPEEVCLPLCRVRPHLREIRLDPTTLVAILETDLLSSFPKLQTIRVQQRLSREPRGSEFREKLEDPSSRNELVTQSHQYSYCCPVGKFDNEYAKTKGLISGRKLKLASILDRSTSQNNLPIIVDVAVDFNGEPWHAAQRIEPVYPVVRNVSAVRFSYEWPEKSLLSMEVEMWSQPMVMAFKSKATEEIILPVEDVRRVDETKPLVNALEV